MKRLLIADACEEFSLALAERLENSYQILMSRDGNETLELLRSFRPDLLVLDMELPGLDGISLLQWAGEEGTLPVTLATIRHEFPYATDRIGALGAAYLMRKPCNLRAMEQRLADLAAEERFSRQPAPADSRTRVINLLLELGVRSKRRGFQCLIEAVLEMMREPTQQITKSLYPRVADTCDGNAIQVERAIRAVIEEAWINRDRENWRRYLPQEIWAGTKRPANAAFICAVASRLTVAERGRREYGARHVG